MKVKVIVSILLPIVILATALGMNFTNFLMGWSATSLNLLVTLGYWLTWVVLFVLFFKNRKVMKYYSIFWLATTIGAFITILYNIKIVPVWFDDTFVLPFVLLLLPQWYGIKFIAEDTLTSVVIIFFIALMMSFTTLFFYKKINFKPFFNYRGKPE